MELSWLPERSVLGPGVRSVAVLRLDDIVVEPGVPPRRGRIAPQSVRPGTTAEVIVGKWPTPQTLRALAFYVLDADEVVLRGTDPHRVAMISRELVAAISARREEMAAVRARLWAVPASSDQAADDARQGAQ